MPRPKAVPVVRKVTQEDVAIFLATNKRKRNRVLSSKAKRDTVEASAAAMLADFTALNLFDILKTKKKKRVNLGFIVERLLTLLDDEATRVADRIAILDRLKDLILLGAIQDPDLASRLEGAVSTADDPFQTMPLKLKKEA